MVELSSFINSKLLSEAYVIAKSHLKKYGITLLKSEGFVRNTIHNHISFVSNWSNAINFKDLNKAKRITDIHIELDYYLNLRRDDLMVFKRDRIPLKQVLEVDNNHLVILGHPGAGKTTTMKFICQSIFHSEKFHPEFKFPVVVRLRELSEEKIIGLNDTLFKRLFHTLGLRAHDEESQFPYSSIPIRESVINMLDTLGALVILDGFDEINPTEQKNKILNEFEYLCLNLNNARVILTSRIGDFQGSINNTTVYEISSLDDDQIKSFAKRWLEPNENYLNLLHQIKKSPFYDTAIRPLTMAHLCALYEKYGTVPEKPKDIYRKIINLLIEEWDAQRLVLRKSKFTQFTNERKFEFLCALSYQLTLELNKSLFSINEITEVFQLICSDFGLEINDQNYLLNELEAHTGLFLQVGYESFEFAHKSLQEFLASEHLIKLAMIPNESSVITMLPNELAIATSISSNPSQYFCTLILNSFDKVDKNTVAVYLNRLAIENPDFKPEPIVGASLFYLRRLNLISTTCDTFITDLIKKIPAVKKSIQELPNHYSYVRSAQLGDEMILYDNRESLKKWGLVGPMAIQFNSKYLDLMGWKKWPSND